MRTKKYFLFIFMIFFIKMNAQDNIDIVFSETEINKALDVIIESRAINFGEYLDQNGINAWYLNLDDAYFDIKTNNSITISNISVHGAVDLSLWVYGETPSGQVTGSIDGVFNVSGNYTDGYFLNIVPTDVTLDYDGPLQSVADVILAVTNDFEDYIPPIEISMGKSLMPDMLLKYFKTGIPLITSTNDEIRLRFEVLFDNLVIKNKIVKSGENVILKADNSMTFNGSLLVEQGATFSALIE